MLVASDAVEVCSTQFVNIAQLYGALADAGITMVIALSSSNWRGRQSSTRRLASPSCAGRNQRLRAREYRRAARQQQDHHHHQNRRDRN
jgi:hypothetical protein